MTRNRENGVQTPMVWQGYGGNRRIEKVTTVTRRVRTEPSGTYAEGFPALSLEGFIRAPKSTDARADGGW